MNMRIHVIEVSTEVFHLLQERAPWLIEWAEQKPGPTQKILLPDDVYVELIDRAISHRQTLDQVVRAACAQTHSQTSSKTDGGHGNRVRRSY